MSNRPRKPASLQSNGANESSGSDLAEIGPSCLPFVMDRDIKSIQRYQAVNLIEILSSSAPHVSDWHVGRRHNEGCHQKCGNFKLHDRTRFLDAGIKAFVDECSRLTIFSIMLRLHTFTLWVCPGFWRRIKNSFFLESSSAEHHAGTDPDITYVIRGRFNTFGVKGVVLMIYAVVVYDPFDEFIFISGAFTQRIR